MKNKNYILEDKCLGLQASIYIETLPDYFLKENSNVNRKSLLRWQISEGLDRESSVRIRTQNYFEHNLLSLENLFFRIQIVWKPTAVPGLLT